MAKTLRLFVGGSLSISDATLIPRLSVKGLQPQPGDTIVLGANSLAITSPAFPGDYNYVIAAETLTVTSSITVTGTDLNKSPSLTVLADQVQGALNLISAGARGSNGYTGKDGGMGTKTDAHGNKHLVGLPGADGGPGGNGAPGGCVTVNYCAAAPPPTASAPGGAFGEGGPGGCGGVNPPAAQPPLTAPNGKPGLDGHVGPPGQAIVSQVQKSALWKLLDSDSETLRLRAGVSGANDVILCGSELLVEQSDTTAWGDGLATHVDEDTYMMDTKLNADYQAFSIQASHVFHRDSDAHDSTVCVPIALQPGGGNIGIGTSKPGAGLEIQKGATNDLALLLNSSGRGWGSGIQFKNTAQGGKTFGIYSGGGILHFADIDNLIDRAVIDGGGNVGIGTTAPTASLEIRTRSNPATSAQQSALCLTGDGGSAGLELKDTVTGGSTFRLFNSLGDFSLGDDNGNFFLRIQDPNYTHFHAPHKVNQGDVYLWNLHVQQDVSLAGADCAEEFDVGGAGRAEPGTVLVIGDEGSLRESSEAYDKRVAGVVSGAGGFRHALVLDRRPCNDARAAVALVGKVCCKVDADQSPIRVGDLLTTSPTPGHAMKATEPLKAFGSVLGKALAPLAAGRGLIPILVALQ